MPRSFFLIASALVVWSSAAASSCNCTCPTGTVCSAGGCWNNTFRVTRISPNISSYTVVGRAVLGNPVLVVLETSGGRALEGAQPSVSCFLWYDYVTSFGANWENPLTLQFSYLEAGPGATDRWTVVANLSEEHTKMEATAYCVPATDPTNQKWLEGSDVGKNIQFELEVLPTITYISDRDHMLGKVQNASGGKALINLLVGSNPYKSVVGLRPVPYLECYLHYGTVNNFGEAWSSISDQGMIWTGAYSANDTLDTWKYTLKMSSSRMEVTAFCSVLHSKQGLVWVSTAGVNWLFNRVD